MAIEIKLDAFEGPLDLLLHLIEKNKVDIYDIPIVMITNQYMEIIKSMDQYDMNVMSEFLVMAATLLDIKCKMLLPIEVNEEGEEEDPRAELVERLLEYKLYKYMSFELKDRQFNAEKSFYKTATIPKEIEAYRQPVDYEELIGDLNLKKLNEIFQFVVRKQEEKIDPVRSKFGKIEKDEVNLEQKTQDIERMLEENKCLSFRQLLEDQRGKMEIIVTFLIILEMMKIGKIFIEQQDTFGEILIKKG